MTDRTRDELLAAWAADLGSWAIPPDILAHAESAPWGHAVQMFTVHGEVPDSRSHQIAREALPLEGSVLDVGSGGGRASAALVPGAGMLTAVDHDAGMLAAFADMAVARGVRHHEFQGQWPAVADDVPEADVVVSHHVAFNVPDIAPFLEALDGHARRRVVLEVPMHHPLTWMNPLWKKFWDLDRPTRPSARDLHVIARSLDLDAQIEVWQDFTWGRRVEMSPDDRVDFVRTRLCLPLDRADEVRAAIAEVQDDAPRELVTIWWDVQR